jgi:hypothetical protein
MIEFVVRRAAGASTDSDAFAGLTRQMNRHHAASAVAETTNDELRRLGRRIQGYWCIGDPLTALLVMLSFWFFAI